MKLEKLREIAIAATPGPWEHVHVYAGEEVIYQSELNLCVASLRSQFDAKHIATFSPEMVLKLLDCVEALEFYADEDDVWGACQPEDTFETCCHIVAETRGGDRAREALAALKGTK